MSQSTRRICWIWRAFSDERILKWHSKRLLRIRFLKSKINLRAFWVRLKKMMMVDLGRCHSQKLKTRIYLMIFCSKNSTYLMWSWLSSTWKSPSPRLKVVSHNKFVCSLRTSLSLILQCLRAAFSSLKTIHLCQDPPGTRTMPQLSP